MLNFLILIDFYFLFIFFAMPGVDSALFLYYFIPQTFSKTVPT